MLSYLRERYPMVEILILNLHSPPFFVLSLLRIHQQLPMDRSVCRTMLLVILRRKRMSACNCNLVSA